MIRSIHKSAADEQGKQKYLTVNEYFKTIQSMQNVFTKDRKLECGCCLEFSETSHSEYFPADPESESHAQ